jgi:hypothetical protein
LQEGGYTKHSQPANVHCEVVRRPTRRTLVSKVASAPAEAILTSKCHENILALLNFGQSSSFIPCTERRICRTRFKHHVLIGIADDTVAINVIECAMLAAHACAVMREWSDTN